MLFQLAFNIGQGELSGVNRNIEFRQEPRQPADVVLVAVRQHDGANMLAILEQIAEVGNDNVDAQQLGFRKHQSGVDDDNVVAPANGHAIHAKFAESAQRDDLQFAGWHR